MAAACSASPHQPARRGSTTLATDNGLLGTWIGSTMGMVAADALAIVVGQQLGARLPERTITVGAAITFVALGLFLIIDGLLSEAATEPVALLSPSGDPPPSR